jgi:DNA polymerase V
LGKHNEFHNEALLYKLFGINAELLIDHAWGYEPCTIKDIKNYKPSTNSISSGQVLHCAYNFKAARLVVQEMTDLLVLDLVDKNLVTDQIVLTIGYDIENLTNPEIKYKGEVTTDNYGRKIPKHAHGTANIGRQTSSSKMIISAVTELYEKIVNPNLLIRRITVTANRVIDEKDIKQDVTSHQLDLFTDYEAEEKQREKENAELKKEKQIQKAVLDIKKKFGKNAILKGMNLEEGATAVQRNSQIGGHKA